MYIIFKPSRNKRANGIRNIVGENARHIRYRKIDAVIIRVNLSDQYFVNPLRDGHIAAGEFVSKLLPNQSERRVWNIASAGTGPACLMMVKSPFIRVRDTTNINHIIGVFELSAIARANNLRIIAKSEQKRG